MTEPKVDMVNHPPHYNKHPSGIQVIEIIEGMNFPNLANVVKYICRAPHKGREREDLEKAIWYLNRERDRRKASYGDSTIGAFLVSGIDTFESSGRTDHSKVNKYLSLESDGAVVAALASVYCMDENVGPVGLTAYTSALRMLDVLIVFAGRKEKKKEKENDG